MTETAQHDQNCPPGQENRPGTHVPAADIITKGAGQITEMAVEEGGHLAIKAATGVAVKGAGAEIAHVTAKGSGAAGIATMIGPAGTALAFGVEYGVSRLVGETPGEAVVGSAASVVSGLAAAGAGASVLTVGGVGVISAVSAKGIYKIATGETRHENLSAIVEGGLIPAGEFATELQNPQSHIRKTVTAKLTTDFDAKNHDMKQMLGSSYDQVMGPSKTLHVKEQVAQLIMDNAQRPSIPNNFGLAEKDVAGGFTSPGIIAANKELHAHDAHAHNNASPHVAPPAAAANAPSGVSNEVLAAAMACGLKKAGVSTDSPGANAATAPRQQVHQAVRGRH